MASREEGKGVLSRVVRMMSAPTRELVGLGADSGGSQFAEAEKAELKAMIERKRRNDFVRKRELNMLRRIRREGLTPEQAAALDASSNIDDSEVRPTQPPGGADVGVKAKIDAIEQQMVGSAPPLRPTPARPVSAGARRVDTASPDGAATIPAGMVVDGMDENTRPMMMMPADEAALRSAPTLTEAVAPALQVRRGDTLPLVEVSEVVHDHDLDEAVIAFANADFAHAERALVTLVGPGGARHEHAETWLTLFDLYRATGQMQRFETLVAEYGHRFQTSPPQWYSLPRLVADASQSGMLAPQPKDSEIGWVCPPTLDSAGLTDLSSRCMQLPQPWVLDWTALQRVQPEAANQLTRLCREWALQPLQMRWLASDRLFAVLGEAAPVGVRDADPGYWMARLEALRLTNRPDQFDEVAIDYCVTYEVSPPSWEPSRCVARVGSSAANTRASSLSVVGDAVTTIQGGDSHHGVAVTTLDLSGQLSGDLGVVLKTLDAKLGGAQVVRISCALLIRVDFIAAGDLLNWIIARKGEGRHISFIEVHRLVAAMFGAMGIGEHAPVHLRQA
ncbi:STAS domain-containing protein [Ideonella sp. 4Y11]|uniref:STAS domain-containing protein n=1 Tax=Ideonella aquatica TaxID=2824119 RepID=A0A941BG00_9BURK|nr:STAS domain-containing protein [Ideonella aquatica]MBQ0959306.1 STAS domain-containing protein [Ideonella aquatica]